MDCKGKPFEFEPKCFESSQQMARVRALSSPKLPIWRELEVNTQKDAEGMSRGGAIRLMIGWKLCII